MDKGQEISWLSCLASEEHCAYGVRVCQTDPAKNTPGPTCLAVIQGLAQLAQALVVTSRPEITYVVADGAYRTGDFWMGWRRWAGIGYPLGGANYPTTPICATGIPPPPSPSGAVPYLGRPLHTCGPVLPHRSDPVRRRGHLVRRGPTLGGLLCRDAKQHWGLNHCQARAAPVGIFTAMSSSPLSSEPR